MSTNFAMKNVKIRAFGNTTTIPNNAIAKMMYYLNCVSVVVDYHDRTLTDYQNYDELTASQLLAIYLLIKILPPSLFIEKGIFIVDKKLLIDTNNQFYEITDETVGFNASREIEIGGKTVKVLKLMACDDDWLSTYYFMPIKQVDDLIKQIKEEEERRNYQSQIIDTQTSIKDYTIAITKEFKRSPVIIFCPICKRAITTRTEKKLNFFALCCCLLCSLGYFCFKLLNWDNVLCFDVVHYCPECGSKIGYYDAFDF